MKHWIYSLILASFVLSGPAFAKKKDITHDKAKKECIKKTPGLKGKKLRDCIRETKKKSLL